MSRNKHTGEKATATKAERRHCKVVDQAIREQGKDGVMAPKTAARYDATFAALHREAIRYQAR